MILDSRGGGEDRCLTTINPQVMKQSEDYLVGP